KLGLSTIEGKDYILIPYYVNGNLAYAKYRSLPPGKKEYRGISGREIPIYNHGALKPGLSDLLLVEGEMDAIACLSAGVQSVVRIQGANIKKAQWIDTIDEINPGKIYLLYDNDKTGQAAARDMAARIGIEKVYNIVLPEFTKEDGSHGKDINEYFVAGHTLADLEALKEHAKPFDVAGVTSVHDALDELEHDLES